MMGLPYSEPFTPSFLSPRGKQESFQCWEGMTDGQDCSWKACKERKTTVSPSKSFGMRRGRPPEITGTDPNWEREGSLGVVCVCRG